MARKHYGPWYQRQLERRKQERAEAAAQRPPKPPRPPGRGEWYQRWLERRKQERAAAAAFREPRPPGIVASGRLREYNREWMRAHYVPRSRRAQPKRPRPPRIPAAPIPVIEAHPLIIEAVAALRPYERAELGSDMDAIARDLVAEYVLAVLEGCDGADAMRRERARYRHDRHALVYGTSLTTGLDR